MTEGRFHVKNPLTFQAEQASGLVSFAGRFNDSIKLITEQHIVNAKSILNILALDVCPGESILIRVDGPNEKYTLRQLMNYMETL